ncbi:MAG TPA: hypothetical protein VLL97_03175, partial [Acidobacteriota bacterium]|nr:hypothetical protein [Acidobacteriota bacterium]
MKIDIRVERILGAAQSGLPPAKEECAFLLSLPELSIEASLIRAVANATSRRRFGNEAIVLGQIGVEISACTGRCRFCGFGEGHTTFEPGMMPDEELLAGTSNFTASGELYALFLMTMHTFDFSRLLHIVRMVRERIPKETQI